MLISDSPAVALGAHTESAGELLVEVIQERHLMSAEAHQRSGSRYTMGYGSQWRDLLDDVHEAFGARGYQAYKVVPGGYSLPIVNGSLLYVWRVRGASDPSRGFAESPTRKNALEAKAPLTLFDYPAPPSVSPENTDKVDYTGEEHIAHPKRVMRSLESPMPMVLVMIHSSPRGIRDIQWAVASLASDDGDVEFHGLDMLWRPAAHVAENTSGQAQDVKDTVSEPFDSGPPVGPLVKPYADEQEGSNA